MDPDQPAIRDTLLIGYDPRPQLKRPTTEASQATLQVIADILTNTR